MPRVHLVDDEPALLFTLTELLKSRSVDAVVARSAKEALTKLEGVDAVVTDYSMPEMDGVQLLQAIRERDESLPVILLTAHGSERVAVRSMKSGACEYETKPFDIDEISLVSDRALEARSLRVENARAERWKWRNRSGSVRGRVLAIRRPRRRAARGRRVGPARTARRAGAQHHRSDAGGGLRKSIRGRPPPRAEPELLDRPPEEVRIRGRTAEPTP